VLYFSLVAPAIAYYLFFLHVVLYIVFLVNKWWWLQPNRSRPERVPKYNYAFYTQIRISFLADFN